jgi:hypothetical protein
VAKRLSDSQFVTDLGGEGVEGDGTLDPMKAVRDLRRRVDDARWRAKVTKRHAQQLVGPVAPPPCPPGWQTGPPDYVGVGIQKAGTSWWNLGIAEHPDVDPSVRKELHFFQHQWDRDFGADDVQDYHRYFPRRPGHLSGEWTPRYLLDPWTPGRLRQAAPDARLLVLLRDPIERFRSGTTHNLARFDTLHPRFLIEATERGRYASLLARLLEHFPREQVLVLQFEKCISRPEPEMARTYGFLGLDPDFRPPILDRRVSAARREKLVLPDDFCAALYREYEPEAVRLAAEWPEIDLSLWPNFAHLTDE